MKDDKLYLIHIIECIEHIESYISQIDRDAFMDTTLVQDAVMRNLQVIAESTQRLSEQAKHSRKEIDWYKIAGFRNILVHDYLGIDVEMVWNIIAKDIPVLKRAIQAMMS